METTPTTADLMEDPNYSLMKALICSIMIGVRKKRDLISAKEHRVRDLRL